jgi:hypothetical protein
MVGVVEPAPVALAVLEADGVAVTVPLGVADNMGVAVDVDVAAVGDVVGDGGDAVTAGSNVPS